MQWKLRNVTPLTILDLLKPHGRWLVRLPRLLGGLYNPNFTAHWCSWLTRCPLKAEITGSSPVCATNKISEQLAVSSEQLEN